MRVLSTNSERKTSNTSAASDGSLREVTESVRSYVTRRPHGRIGRAKQQKLVLFMRFVAFVDLNSTRLNITDQSLPHSL